MLTKSLLIWHLETNDRWEEFLLCCDCAIMEAWLPFMMCRTKLSNIAVWLKFVIYADCGGIAVTASTIYMTCGTLWWIPCPLLPETMIIIDRDCGTIIYIEWSIITTILLPFLTWWLTPCPCIYSTTSVQQGKVYTQAFLSPRVSYAFHAL